MGLSTQLTKRLDDLMTGGAVLSEEEVDRIMKEAARQRQETESAQKQTDGTWFHQAVKGIGELRYDPAEINRLQQSAADNREAKKQWLGQSGYRLATGQTTPEKAMEGEASDTALSRFNRGEGPVSAQPWDKSLRKENEARIPSGKTPASESSPLRLDERVFANQETKIGENGQRARAYLGKSLPGGFGQENPLTTLFDAFFHKNYWAGRRGLPPNSLSKGTEDRLFPEYIGRHIYYSGENDARTDAPEMLAKAAGMGDNGSGEANGKKTGAAEAPDKLSLSELYSGVMTPGQKRFLSSMNDEVLEMLTEDQKRRLYAGENLAGLLEEIHPAGRERINRLSEAVHRTLNQEQKNELLFLGSGMLEGIDLEARLSILQHLKSNDGRIGYEDLVELGVYEPGELAEGGFKRFLQNLDTGGPANFGKLLEKEYELSDWGTSFAQLDQEDRQRRGEQITLLLAMTAGALTDRMLYGPSGVIYGDNVYDNLERQGTQQSFKGSDFSWRPARREPSGSGGRTPQYPGNDPFKAPAEGYEWRGHPKKGSWYNPETREVLRSDIEHADPIGAHWDYRAPNGTWYRLYPDGHIEPK